MIEAWLINKAGEFGVDLEENELDEYRRYAPES
jgi:hypothetical protein